MARLKKRFRKPIQCSLTGMWHVQNGFKGWNLDGTHFDHKLDQYTKIISKIEHEIKKNNDRLNDVKDTIREMLEETLQMGVIQVAINNLPSFTTNLKKAAEFISQFIDDSYFLEDSVQDDEAVHFISYSELKPSNDISGKHNEVKCNRLNEVKFINSPELSKDIKLVQQPVIKLVPLKLSDVEKYSWSNVCVPFDNVNTKLKVSFEDDISQISNDDQEVYPSVKDVFSLVPQERNNGETDSIPETSDNSFVQSSDSPSVTTPTKETLDDYSQDEPKMYFEEKEDVIETFISVLKKTADDSEIISSLDREFICSYCEGCFFTRNSMKRHIMVCSKRTDDMYCDRIKRKKRGKKHECKLCQTVLSCKGAFDRHNETAHNLKKKFKCLLCGWMFYNERALQQHCTSRHGIGKNPYKCPHCEDSFRRRPELNYHCRKYHRGKAWFMCTICLKSFASEGLCKLHEKSHGYVCDVCEFTTTTETEIVKHRLTHLEVSKPYKCSFCFKSIRRKGSFAKHVLVHTEKNKC